jgi:hypothetical protein
VFPISRYVSHIFITVGDHPDELGNQIVEVFRRAKTTDGALLSARFGGFRQGLLKSA